MKFVNILAVTLFSMISFAASRRRRADKEGAACGDLDNNEATPPEKCAEPMVCCEFGAVKDGKGICVNDADKNCEGTVIATRKRRY